MQAGEEPVSRSGRAVSVGVGAGIRTMLPLLLLAAAVSLGGCRAAPEGTGPESQNDLPATREDGAGAGESAESVRSAAERQHRSEVVAAQEREVEALERAAAEERLAAQERERAAAEARARAVEERERQVAVERERVAAAERAVAEREARVLAEERALAVEKERRALERQQEELAARDAELRERERLLAQQAQAEAPGEPAVDDTVDTDDTAEDEDTVAVASASPPDPVHERAVLVDHDSRAPAPREVEASLSAGSVLEVEIQERLTSRTAQVGDIFSTRAARDIRNDDGQVVIPVDSTIVGRVTEVTPLRKVGGQAALGLEFTELVLPDGSRVAIRASFLELGKDKKGDKKKIAIAAAAGAVLGAVLGHDAGGAAAGAAVGAAAGTAVVLTAKDQDVEIAAGELIAMRLEEVVTVKTRMAGLAP